ncbi:MAG: Gfo/Idh/MocA family oxidoreductase [Desulfobacterales bacterium]|nr:Gfo/Idh/MocA family oxidoreductase [Desulfobacterales bacterium]
MALAAKDKQKNRKLRVAVIGTGYLGKFHAEKYAKMDDVDLVGVVDINKAQAEEVARKVNTKAYESHKEILDKVDAVSVVVPTPAHFAVSRDFLENDVDVLIEKPMTQTLAEADELIRFSEKRGLIIQVGHLERFNPAVVALRDKDIIKKPLFIESHRLSIYQERGTDVSVVLDLMIHDIDIILNFVRAEVKNIHAAGVAVITRHIDIANARLEFENGCVANVTASRISMKNERKIRLFQRDAYISVDFAKREITVINQGDKTGEGLIPGMQVNQLNFTQRDALEDELSAFVGAVRRREVPAVTGQMGREALHIALNIMDQIHSANRRFSGL